VNPNYSKLEMTLLPNKNKKIETNVLSFGFNAHKDKNGEIRISGILEGSPAEKAGLNAGDEIINFKVNNTNLSFEDVAIFLFGDKDITLYLQIVNNSGKREVMLQKLTCCLIYKIIILYENCASPLK